MGKFDWTKKEEGGNGMDRERIPVGVHKVHVSRIIYKVKDEPITSKKGDPQILLVLEDDHKRECLERVTLSETTAWKLRQLMESGGVDLKKLNEAGVEPKDFTNEDVASQWIPATPLWIEVVQKGEYLNVKVLKPDHPKVKKAEAAGASSVTAEAQQDEIPF